MKKEDNLLRPLEDRMINIRINFKICRYDEFDGVSSEIRKPSERGIIFIPYILQLVVLFIRLVFLFDLRDNKSHESNR